LAKVEIAVESHPFEPRLFDESTVEELVVCDVIVILEAGLVLKDKKELAN
jgi:hypothetical protein